MATKESMMNFISNSPKASDYVPYVADSEAPEDTAPKLEILSCPAAVRKKLVVVSGTLEDSESREPRLYINQKDVSVRGGKWLASVPVADGANHIVVMAMNNTGKTVFAYREVYCGTLPPRLEVDDIPELTSKQSVTISGTVTDMNAGVSEMPEVSINNSAIEVGENGKWSCTVKANDGDNVFVIAAKSGSATVAVKKSFIRYADAPELNLIDFHDSSPILLPQVQGTLVSATGKVCRLRVNDQDVPVSSDGKFSTKVKLRQTDSPPVTFTVVSNSTYTIQKKLKFDPPPPVNIVTKCEPAQKRILYRVAGTATDPTGAISSVSLNGKEITLNKGAWNTVITAKYGFTPLVIITKNSFGKTSVLLGNIYLEQLPPEVSITSCPETTRSAEVTVSGIVKDPDGECPPVVFVNHLLAKVNGEEWEATIPLMPACVNTVNVTAKSDTGKSTDISCEVNCTLVVPTIKVLNCPRETDSPELTLRGFARSNYADDQNNLKMLINGKEVEFLDGKWTYSVTLNKGRNFFLIAAVNKDGERTEVEKTVMLV